MIEIERRFLCRVSPDFRPTEELRLRQGYLAGGDLQIRIRSLNGTFILGAKCGEGLERLEREVEVPDEAGRLLMAQAGAWSLRKTRKLAGRWEVDAYEGKLEGLTVAECELETGDEALPPPPDGVELLREVTEDLDFTAQRLAALTKEGCRELIQSLDVGPPDG